MRFFGLAAAIAHVLAVPLPASTPIIPRELLEGLPVEVSTMATRVAECSSLSSTEVARERDEVRVERAMETLQCDSLPGELGTLRRKYALSARTVKVIDLFLDLLP
jgi:hypothetical protein